MDHFWPFYSASPQKNSKKYTKNGPSKKTPFLLKNEKWQIFFLRRAINSTKMVKNSKFFCSITSYAPNDTEKNFCDHWSHIREMNSRFLKKNVSPKIQVRLESLPICKTFNRHEGIFVPPQLSLALLVPKPKFSIGSCTVIVMVNQLDYGVRYTP